MRVRDIMSTPVIGIAPEATIDETAEVMLDRGFTTLPVVTADGILLGLITEAHLGAARWGSPPDSGPHLVRQVMRAPALAVAAEADLADLANAMVESHQRCLPVIEDGHLCGMVSWRDLLSHYAPEWERPRHDSPVG
ncbi:CBS domain-containing protein [Amycolatopsis sp. K13G38]|uniref:CBS domain-containing protein n=1 Tax=Amycolatopsis acididurans TaxID=2724524 RepID=A0ABX1IX55_9PSEU|nr:CBS domain-containing protein [Amycolatopsis acididurans]NKQ52048.1 CBS domain-containing protein [Amycolatopsis acididurans]